MKNSASKYPWIRYVYLYLITAIAIIIMIISSIGFIRLVLEEYVFDLKSWNEIESIRPYQCEDNVLFPVPPVMADGSVKPIVADSVVATSSTLTDEEKEAKYNKCVADAQEKARIQDENDLKRSLINYFAMLIVSIPLYIYHWGVIKKDSKK